MAVPKAQLQASIIAAVMIAVAPAGAQDPAARAKAHYERAVQLFGEASYASALAELERANELRPSYKLFHIIAQVQVAMNDPAAALTSYRKYLEQGGQRITPERRFQVTEEITALGRRVATLTISADLGGAEVWVDDARAGITPLRAPLVVNAGGHRISLRHPNYPPQIELVNLVGGASDRVEFKLGSATPAPPRAPRGTAAGPGGAAGPVLAPATLEPTEPASLQLGSPPRKGDWWRDHAWIGWVVTGTLAAGATATGIWAISSNSTLSSQREGAATGGATRAQLEWSSWRVRTLATVTDALWIATGVAGGASLWFTLRSDEPQRLPETSAARPLRVRLGASGVSLEGSF
jgi:hypothetical protein